VAAPASVTLGNLGGNTARVYALAGSASVGAYITHANNHSSVVTGATATLSVPASVVTATWMNPFDGTILGTATLSAGSQTLIIPAFSQDILRIGAGSTGPVFPPSGVTFRADPNPITPSAGIIVGKTSLTWNAPGFSALQIWVAGQLMASGLPTAGSADTGNWVSDGMVFSLVDSASGQRISTVTIHINPASSQVSFTANPNPITPIAGTTVGKTSLAWSAPGFSALQIWVQGSSWHQDSRRGDQPRPATGFRMEWCSR
jgi:hypothetical protein